MSVTLYRCSHEPEDLSPRFERLFEKTDMLFIENVDPRYYAEKMRNINMISAGRLAPETSTTSTYYALDFHRKLTSAIYRSGKRVVLEKSPIKYKPDNGSTGERIKRSLISGNISAALKMYIDDHKATMWRTRTRNDALPGQIRDLYMEDPDANILAIFGSMHSIIRPLKASGVKAHQEFPCSPYVFPLCIELDNYIYNGRQFPKVLAEKALLERVVNHRVFYIDGLRGQEAVVAARKIVEEIYPSGFREISKLMRNTYADYMLAMMHKLKISVD